MAAAQLLQLASCVDHWRRTGDADALGKLMEQLARPHGPAAAMAAGACQAVCARAAVDASGARHVVRALGAQHWPVLRAALRIAGVTAAEVHALLSCDDPGYTEPPPAADTALVDAATGILMGMMHAVDGPSPAEALTALDAMFTD